MKNEDRLKKIMKQGGAEKAPPMFSHNVMAELYRQQAFRATLNQPLIGKRGWWIIGALVTLLFCLVVFTVTDFQKTELALSDQLTYQFVFWVNALNYHHLLILGGILLLLFIETALRKQHYLKHKNNP